jgi:hypothetical protein
LKICDEWQQGCARTFSNRRPATNAGLRYEVLPGGGKMILREAFAGKSFRLDPYQPRA